MIDVFIILQCYKKEIIHFGNKKLFLKTSNKSYQSDDIVLSYNKHVKIKLFNINLVSNKT